MFNDLNKEIGDMFADLWGNETKRIIFVCDPHTAPFEILQYLESFGIKCIPAQRVDIDQETGCRTACIRVPAHQHLWAAKLANGYGVTVLEPNNAGSVKPAARWGVTRQHNGPTANVLRLFAGLFGVGARLAPKKGKR